MKKRILSLLLAGTVAFALLAGCGKSDDAASYNIGIIQHAEHPALDAATEGFQDALKALLGDSVSFTVSNAQGEFANNATIATKYVNDGVDLILANATPSAQAASEATAEIPIIATSVTDFVIAGLVESNEAPGRNVTGTSDLSPISEQVALTSVFVPDAQAVGIIYCSSEDNSIVQADEAEQEYLARGYAVNRYTAADSNDIQAVVTKAIGEVDVLYIPTDNLFAENMQIVKNLTVPAQMPVICGEENMTLEGGLATKSINYYNLGYFAGEMAYEILTGVQEPSTYPVRFITSDEDLNVVINTEIAEAIGIEIPEGLLD